MHIALSLPLGSVTAVRSVRSQCDCERSEGIVRSLEIGSKVWISVVLKFKLFSGEIIEAQVSYFPTIALLELTIALSSRFWQQSVRPWMNTWLILDTRVSWSVHQLLEVPEEWVVEQDLRR